jgi:hypothetical protein
MSDYELLVLGVEDIKAGDLLMLTEEGTRVTLFREITKISKAPKDEFTSRKVLKLKHWHNDVWLHPEELTVIARKK